MLHMHVIHLNSLLLLGLLPLTVLGFQFTTEPAAPASCDKLALTWSGGQGPFRLHLIPVFGTPRDIAIPDNAVLNGQGTFSVDELPFAENAEFLIAMSDSTGFDAGGVTTVLRAARSGKSCNTRDPGVDFSFQLNSELQQCRPYIFSGFDRAAKPVRVTGIVPGGNTFTLNSNGNDNNLDWVANVREGTSVIFVMTDAQGKQGGSSSVLSVGGSGDQGCINADSPATTSSTTSSGPTSTFPSNTATTTTNTRTSTASVNPSGTAAAGSTSEGSTSNAGSIAGGVIGALIAVAAIVGLLFFYMKRRRTERQWDGPTPLADSPFPTSMLSGYPPSRGPDPFLDPGHSQKGANPFADPTTTNYQPPPPTSYPSNFAPQFSGPQQPWTPPKIIRGPPPGTEVDLELTYPMSMTNVAPVPGFAPAPAAASEKHQQPVPRLVVHNDITPSQPDLPPQYSDRRVSAAESQLSRHSLAYMNDAYASDTFVEEPRR